MDASFDACLKIILASEGGFVDDVQDPGGATNLGVTLETLSAWRHAPQTIADVEALTEADVAPIYRADYFNAAHCPDWPAGVDLMVFDAAVNSGVGRAIRTLQEAAGAVPDGLAGPATHAAVAVITPAQIIGRFADLREAFYRSLATFPRFGAGWLARVERTKVAALAMAAE